MKIKRGTSLEKIKLQLTGHLRYKMKKRDKKLLIESISLTIIYLLSFGILSLGRVQQAFFGISESTFSSIQLITLTFVFAVIITLVIYYLYRKAIQ
jgi:hypothetical protein